MEQARWTQIDRLLDEALALSPDARAAFLTTACAGDDDLRQEVESLLVAQEQAEPFLNTPALNLAARQLATEPQPALIGQQFGPYQVLARLGSGGMGEVYLAEDERLGRKLSLKLLPPHCTTDPERVQRFAREARAASALNHPNIITIYDIGEAGPQHFIAAEFIEGQTLRDLLAHGALPAKDLVEIGVQIASALAAAHQNNIIHRDIKPENVMRRADGYVKVLDFGLARMAEGPAAQANRARTTPGLILGTVSYMSPEQALGNDLDHRSDLFSLGVVLYELATGQQPFTGPTPISIADKIIHQPPKPLAECQADLPPALAQIIHRALAKDPAQRYQSAPALRADLQRVQRALDLRSTNEMVPRETAWKPPRHPRHKWLFAAAALGFLLATGFWYWRLRTVAPAPLADWATAKYAELTEFPGIKTTPTLSPDGQFIVYARKVNNQFDLFRQRVGGSKAQNLTEGSAADDNEPAFSPDGAWLAFRSERDGGGLYVIGATGENLRRLVSGGYNPAWSPDGTEILYATQRGSNVFQRTAIGSELWAVNGRTGATRRLAAGPDAVQPSWSPHGHRIAFWGLRNASQRDIWTIPAGGGDPVAVTNDSAEDSSPVWSPDGQYLYFSSNRNGRLNLWHVRIDEQTGQPLGPPQPLSVPSQYSTFLTIARDGKRMAYANRLVRAHIRRAPFERGVVTGPVQGVTQTTRRVSNPHLSPDGQWLTYFSLGDPQFDLYVARVDNGETRQLTDDAYRDRAPRWSPDGTRLAFFSDQSGKFEIWTIRPDGSDRQQLTFSTPPQPGFLDPSWAPDGTRLLFSLRGGGDSFLLELSRPFQQQQLFAFPAVSPDGGKFTAYNWSPDGQKIAGVEWRNGNDLPGIVLYDVATQRYERLTHEGDSPSWFPDSRWLLYSQRGRIFRLDSRTKVTAEVLAQPDEVLENPTLTRDGRTLFYDANSTEESIWLISLQ